MPWYMCIRGPQGPVLTFHLCDTGEKETDQLLYKLPPTPVCTSHFPIVTVNLAPQPSFTVTKDAT